MQKKWDHKGLEAVLESMGRTRIGGVSMVKKYSTVFGMALMALTLIVLYQNCGPNEYGLGGVRDPASLDCGGNPACDQNPNHIWLHTPSVYLVYDAERHRIGGDCSVGGYPQNEIRYRAGHRDITTGQETPRGEWRSTHCDSLGRFYATVDFCPNGVCSAPTMNSQFFVELQLRSVGTSGEVYENLSYPNSSSKKINFQFLN